MNERIKQLAEQAGMTKMQQRSDGMYVVDESVFEEFAELIVKECAEVADCNWRNQCPGLYVKEHFGVTE